MKILFISANTFTQPYPAYPIGLDYVINAVSPRHEVKSVDMNELQNGEALAAVLDAFRPDVTGLSIRNIDNIDHVNTQTAVEKIAEWIETIRRHSTAVIILGGSGFTILPREFMSKLDADFGVIGEGERLPVLLEALESHAPVSNLPGILTREGPVVFPEPLGGPFSRGDTSERSYLSFYLKRGGMLNLQTKRGCPYKCIYCTYPQVEGNRFRLVEPDEAARTARRLQDAGARYLYLTDSTFNGHYEHSLKVARAFEKAGVSIPWGAFFTPTAPPPDYYRALADAGLTHVEFGTESLVDSILGAYGKPFRTEDVFASHRSASGAGVHVAHYLLPGGPGEDENTLNATLSNSNRLEKTVFFVFCGVRIYPRTALYAAALREGQITPETDLLSPVFYWSPELDRETAMDCIKEHAAGQMNWILGSGPPVMYKMMAKLYGRGHVGPLWEYLVR